jgi:hypothetical protein
MESKEIEKILDTGKKEFEVKGRKIVVCMPVQSITLAADEIYGETLNRHLRKGTPTQKEQLQELFRRGLFHPGKNYFTKEHDELMEEILEKRKLVFSLEDEEAKKPHLKELSELETKLRGLNRELSAYIYHSCEGYADIEKNIFLLIHCATENDKPIWNSIEEYKNDPDTIFAMQVQMLANRFWLGLDELPFASMFFGEDTLVGELPKNLDTPSGESQSPNGTPTE